MTTARRVLLAVFGMVVTITAVGEHLSRRLIERRYHQVLETHQQLERQVGGVLTTHKQLTNDLTAQRQRTQALTNAVAEKNAELDNTIGRLAEESQTVRELQQQIKVQEQQMAQLQGELADALHLAQAAPAAGTSSAAVELERIMVSNEASPALQGRVISVHPEWNFVVIDLGWDAVKIGDTVSIVRNDALLAKAKVERVQEGIAAAAIMPEWDAKTVQINDHVKLL